MISRQVFLCVYVTFSKIHYFLLKALLYLTHARRLVIDEEILNIHMFQHLSGKQGH